MKVAIAGAGIAGLAAAALLARAGHSVRVFDQFDAPRPVGSGLMVQPVGLAVLHAMGLGDELIDRAAPIGRVYGQTFRNLPVLDVAYADLREGLVGHGVQRSVLFDLLYQAALDSGARLVTSTEITAAADGFLIRQDDRLGPFDLIVDALGAYSPLCPKPSAPLKFGALWALLDWPPSGPFDATALEQRYEYARKMVGVSPVGRSQPGGTEKLTFFWSLRATDYAGWRAQPLAQWKDQVRTLWPETEVILDQITSHDDLTFARQRYRMVRARWQLQGIFKHSA